MLKKIKKRNPLKEVRGILVPSIYHSIDEMSLLSSGGVYYRILKNSKYFQLKSKVGECVRVLARIVHKPDTPLLDIAFFVNEFEMGSAIDELSEPPLHIAEMAFVDYESIYT